MSTKELIREAPSYFDQVRMSTHELRSRNIRTVVVAQIMSESHHLASFVHEGDIKVVETIDEVLEAAMEPGQAGIVPTQSKEGGKVMYDEEEKRSLVSEIMARAGLLNTLASVTAPNEGNPTTMAIIAQR